METKRSNLRFTITVSLALAGLSLSGVALLYRAEPARAQDQGPGEFQPEPGFDQIPPPELPPEPPPQPPQLPEGFDFGQDIERPDEIDPSAFQPPPATAPATAPTTAPAPAVEEPAEPV